MQALNRRESKAMNHAQLNILEVKELIKFKYRQMLAHPGLKIRPLFIEGHSGIGKTQIIRQAAAELTTELAGLIQGCTVECKVMNLQFTERPEFMGLGYVTSENKTAFAYPSLLPESGYGLYFMDEANRVERDIRSGMLTLLEDREINGHKMGSYWLPVLAGNPSIDDLYEVNEFDVALSDRVARVVLTGDMDLTLNHFKSKYQEHPLVAFLNEHKSFLSFEGNGISPRSFEYAIAATIDYHSMSHTALEISLAAELGYEAAELILSFMANKRLPSYQSMLSGSLESLNWLRENPDRNDVIAVINSGLITDLGKRSQSGLEYEKAERENIQNYISLIRDEHKHALLVETASLNLTLTFMRNFVQGTHMTESFIKMYSQQKA
jgi:hypothetical protein